MSLRDGIKSLHQLKNEHLSLFKPLNELAIKLTNRLEQNNYQGLYEDEIQTLCQLAQNNLSIPELSFLLDELITVYSIDVAREYKDVQNTPSEMDDRFSFRKTLVNNYIVVLHEVMRIKSLINKPYTFYYTVMHQLFPSSLEKHESAREYTIQHLNEFEQRLNRILETIREHQLSDEKRFMSDELKHISNYQSAQKGMPLDALSIVQTTFEKQIEQIDLWSKEPLDPDFKIYTKYQGPTYRIQEIRQGICPSIGKSGGMCYGITYSMANPATSPYHSLPKAAPFNLTEAIENYQHGQGSEIDDQKTIKRTRITGKVSGADMTKQADDILKTASLYPEKDLLLMQRYGRSAHACYLSVKPSTNKIHYMDPNHGAYWFNNPAEFIKFYCVIYKTHRPKSYELDLLVFDPNNQEKPSRTFAGKLRSLLTGSKYTKSTAFNSLLLFNFMLYCTSAIYLFTALPILLEASTAIILLAAVSGFVAATTLVVLAHSAGFMGLLSIPNYLYDCWFFNDDIPVNTKGAELETNEYVASAPSYTETLPHPMGYASIRNLHNTLGLFKPAKQMLFCESNGSLSDSDVSSSHELDIKF